MLLPAFPGGLPASEMPAPPITVRSTVAVLAAVLALLGVLVWRSAKELHSAPPLVKGNEQFSHMLR